MNLYLSPPPPFDGTGGWVLFGCILACIVLGVWLLLDPIYKDVSEEDEEEIWGPPLLNVPLYVWLAEPGQAGTKESTLTEPECGKVGCMGRWGMGEHNLCTRAQSSVLVHPGGWCAPSDVFGLYGPGDDGEPEPALAGVCHCGEEDDHEIHDDDSLGGWHPYEDVALWKGFPL